MIDPRAAAARHDRILIERLVELVPTLIVLMTESGRNPPRFGYENAPVTVFNAHLITCRPRPTVEGNDQGPSRQPTYGTSGERRQAMQDLHVDQDQLRHQVRDKYRQVAVAPAGDYHFHTGRRLAKKLGYDQRALAELPDEAVESFAGIANPFTLRALEPGERVVDVGSGGGFDSHIAARLVGDTGTVIGVDMTREMLDKSRTVAWEMRVTNVEFREGLAESLPVESEWADVVISNGVINLCPDKKAVFEEIFRVLRPGGHVQFGDIANGRPVPEGALQDIDLWTG